jgi:phosphoserine phosphatase
MINNHQPPKLVAFDVDGTLLRGETICECIARSIGKIEDARAFELLKTHADITEARRMMLEWYTPHGKEALTSCLSGLRMAPGAQAGIAKLRQHGVQVAFVSITWQFAVEWLAEKLGADYAVGTGWLESGDVGDFWPEDKATWLRELSGRLSISAGEIVAVGDSAGDLPMLSFVGRGYFVGEKMPAVGDHVRHRPGADIGELVEEILAGL